MIKKIINNWHKNTTVLILIAALLCILLLCYRVYTSGTLFFIFLIWNLFLAIVPLVISQFISYSNYIRSNRFLFLSASALWLLFLPNAPYIITDLIHLQHNLSNLVWLDLFLVFAFAIMGLFTGVLSMIKMNALFKQQWSTKTGHLLIIISAFLSGYGVYLGRFLRFNSWDILTNPSSLFLQIIRSLGSEKTWIVTLVFGIFLSLIFFIINSIKEKRTFYTP